MSIDKFINRADAKNKDREFTNNYIPVTLAELKEIASENPEHPEAKNFMDIYNRMTARGKYGDTNIVNIDLNQVLAIRDDKDFAIEQTEDEFKITKKTVVKDKVKKETVEEGEKNNG